MQRASGDGLKAALAHVLWIGGGTDAGKTTITQMLAEQFGLQAYHFDQFDRLEPPGHWSRIDPDRHACMQAALARSLDQSWVETTPERMFEEWLHLEPERFQLTLEDLLALPRTPQIVAEGHGFLPEFVVPLLTSARQAIWLIPTEEFKQASHERRGKGGFRTRTSDPERARRNHIGQ